MLPVPLPVEPRSRLRLRAASNATNRLILEILDRVPRARAPRHHQLLDLTPTGDRTEQTEEVAIPGDELWDFNVRDADGSLERGQTYCAVDFVPPSGGSTIINLARGYVTTFGRLTMGDKDDPFSGHGDTRPESIGTDIAGNVDTAHNLDLTNAIRRIDGFIFYYHADGNASSRESVMRLRDLGSGVPTGFDAGNDRQVMALAGPSLIADEDGIFYMNQFGYHATVDQATVTIANNASAPNPFPLWVNNAETSANLTFDISAGLAGDTYGGYIFGEVWFT